MKDKLEGRIRYFKGEFNANEKYDEWYIFEIKWRSEDEWGLEVAFPLVDDKLHYTALTQIRKWQQLGIPFHFA